MLFKERKGERDLHEEAGSVFQEDRGQILLEERRRKEAEAGRLYRQNIFGCNYTLFVCTYYIFLDNRDIT
jgi:hypothetical protein